MHTVSGVEIHDCMSYFSAEAINCRDQKQLHEGSLCWLTVLEGSRGPESLTVVAKAWHAGLGWGQFEEEEG